MGWYDTMMFAPTKDEGRVIFDEDLPYLVHQREIKRQMRRHTRSTISRDVPTLLTRLVEAALAEAIEGSLQTRPTDKGVLSGDGVKKYMRRAFVKNSSPPAPPPPVKLKKTKPNQTNPNQ